MSRRRHGPFVLNKKTKDLCDSVTAILDGVTLLENYKLSEQCIYRVPSKFRDQNEAAYTPYMVSIGPFHHESHERLEPMQQLKLGYLKSFAERTNLSLEHCCGKLQEWETSIRLCYGKEIDQKIEQISKEDFLRMILIDACFIIEHFIRYYYLVEWRKKDPLFLKPWLTLDVTHDLILLENQLPFFVLEHIFKLATTYNSTFTSNYPSFLELTLHYFKFFNKKNLQPGDVSVQHFTDLLRTFLLPRVSLPRRSKPGIILDHLYSVSQLVESGVKFKANRENKCLIDLQFDERVKALTMPCFEISDMTEILMRNIVALEQFHYPSLTYIIDYLMLLDFLIDVEKDVDILISEGIITSLLGNNKQVAKMINGLNKNVSQVNFNSHYLLLCKELKARHENPVHNRANLMHEYFDTPWKAAGSIAAIVLLLLTLVQTICSILSLLKDLDKI